MKRDQLFVRVLPILLGLFLAALPAAGASLALVSDRRSLETLTALLTAALPEDLELLERDDMDRITTELQLQQDWDPNSPEAAKRIMMLNQADLLAVLSNEADTRATLLTVFDREFGIRLVQTRLDGSDPDAQTAEATAALTDALARYRRVRDRTGVALSFLPPSCIDVAPGSEAFVRRSCQLLTEAVRKRPDVIVLERDFLATLLGEPGWSAKEGVKTLLAGALLAHIEVTRGRTPDEHWFTLRILRPDSSEPVLQYEFFLAASDIGRDRIEELAPQFRFPVAGPGDRAAEGRQFAAQAFAGAMQNRLEEALAAARQAEMLGDGSRESVLLETTLATQQWRSGNRAEALHHFDAATRRAVAWDIDIPQLRLLARELRNQPDGKDSELNTALHTGYMTWLDGFILTPLMVNRREFAQTADTEAKLDRLVAQAELIRQLEECAEIVWAPEAGPKYVPEAWRNFNTDCVTALPALQEADRKRVLQQRIESKLRRCVPVPVADWNPNALAAAPESFRANLRQRAELRLANPFYENALIGAWELAQLDGADPASAQENYRRIKEIFSRPVLLPAALPPQLRIPALAGLLSAMPMVRQLELHDLVSRKIKGYQPLHELILPEQLTPQEAKAVAKAIRHWSKDRRDPALAQLADTRLGELRQRCPELKGEL